MLQNALAYSDNRISSVNQPVTLSLEANVMSNLRSYVTSTGRLVTAGRQAGFSASLFTTVIYDRKMF